MDDKMDWLRFDTLSPWDGETHSFGWKDIHVRESFSHLIHLTN
jgi:hypothetical protein